MQKAITDGLGRPKDGPESCHHNFDPLRRGDSPLRYPQRYSFYGNLENITPTKDLHAPGAISVHGDVPQASLVVLLSVLSSLD